MNEDKIALVSTVTDYANKEEIYHSVEEGFHLLGLDGDHYGSKLWNPLGDQLISSGDTVLIKPNLVMDKNGGGFGTECLYTQVEVVKPVLDYVIRALNGHGKIYIADAPLQDCDFGKLAAQSGYQAMVDSYKVQGHDIELIDMRGVVAETVGGLLHAEKQKNEYRIVDLGTDSEHAGNKIEKIQDYRVTNYDPRIIGRHHNESRHEYAISKYMLEADVVINLPKPKTHRKAGVTAALKNMVGINVRKEYLPHHTKGSKKEGGDEYLVSNVFHRRRSNYLDRKNELLSEKKYMKAGMLRVLMRIDKMFMGMYRDVYDEGSWYGNHTISRTICDLNKILYFADKEGKMRDIPQRIVFHVGDMIISGEGEGPLLPSPHPLGVILMGRNPVTFDHLVTRLMGFDPKKIPTLQVASNMKNYIFGEYGNALITSNNKEYDGKKLEEIESKKTFVASEGWVGHIELI